MTEVKISKFGTEIVKKILLRTFMKSSENKHFSIPIPIPKIENEFRN